MAYYERERWSNVPYQPPEDGKELYDAIKHAQQRAAQAKYTHPSLQYEGRQDGPAFWAPGTHAVDAGYTVAAGYTVDAGYAITGTSTNPVSINPVGSSMIEPGGLVNSDFSVVLTHTSVGAIARGNVIKCRVKFAVGIGNFPKVFAGFQCSTLSLLHQVAKIRDCIGVLTIDGKIVNVAFNYEGPLEPLFRAYDAGIRPAEEYDFDLLSRTIKEPLSQEEISKMNSYLLENRFDTLVIRGHYHTEPIQHEADKITPAKHGDFSFSDYVKPLEGGRRKLGDISGILDGLLQTS